MEGEQQRREDLQAAAGEGHSLLLGSDQRPGDGAFSAGGGEHRESPLSH